MNEQKVKDRVRKLLNLAENDAASEGEIQNAMRAAQAYMDEYHIEREDLREDDAKPVEMREGQAYGGSANVARWEGWLSLAVSNVVGTVGVYSGKSTRRNGFNVKTCGTFTFYGPAEDVRIACELFEEMVGVISTMAAGLYSGVYRGEGRSYCEGFSLELHRRTVQQGKQRSEKCTAIVVRGQAVARHWLERVAGVKLRSRGVGGGGKHHDSAHENGRSDGRSAEFGAKRRGKIAGGLKQLRGGAQAG